MLCRYVVLLAPWLLTANRTATIRDLCTDAVTQDSMTAQKRQRPRSGETGASSQPEQIGTLCGGCRCFATRCSEPQLASYLKAFGISTQSPYQARELVCILHNGRVNSSANATALKLYGSARCHPCVTCAQRSIRLADALANASGMDVRF
jgi:hypothetical protein